MPSRVYYVAMVNLLNSKIGNIRICTIVKFMPEVGVETLIPATTMELLINQ